MNDAPNVAKTKLGRIGRAKDASRRLAWGLLAVAAGLAVLVGAALVDYWLVLSGPWRGLGFLVLVVLVCAAATGWVRLRRRPTHLKEAALDFEARRPEAGCVVSTAAEYLSGERQITREYEPELVAALERQAVKHLNLTCVSYARKMLSPAGLLAGAGLALLLFALLAPSAATALKRTVAPWSKTAYTQVEVQPGNVEIPIGKDLAITNAFTGRAPQNPALHWRDAVHPAWQAVALKPVTNGIYFHLFTNLQHSTAYQVTGGDAVSPPYQVAVYVPPSIQELRLRVQYPDYTRVPPFEAPSPEEVKVLRASELNFQVTTSTNTAKARLRFSALPALELTPGPGHQWTGRLQAAKDTDYWIELADAQGHPGGNEQPYHLKVAPDQPPKVEIIEPGQDLRAEATNTIPLKLSASDDFGVTQIKLVYHKLGGPEQAVACAQTNRENGELIAQAALDLSKLKLREYEVVAYHAEALDNNTLDGPGKGASPVYFVEITSEEGRTNKSQGNSPKVNLLAIQKQIIADTAALAANAPAEKFHDLSERQKEAGEFAKLYADALNQAGPDAGAAAGTLMEQAMQEMKSAESALAQRNRSEAIPPEEKALANLYQVIKLKPELENLPTQPPPESEQNPPTNEVVNVVLEAIKKQAKEQPSNEEIAQALEEAKRLSQSQAGVNQAVERPGQSNAEANAEAKANGQEKSSADKAGAGEKESESKKGQAGANGQANADAQALAQMEEQLSREAAALAEKLAKLEGKDARLGHNAGQSMGQAAAQMAAAARALRQGNASQAGTSGAQGRMQVDKVVALLQRLLKDQPNLSDVAAEDFPKEYEALISEYLKKLSYEE
jgi:hypothetical protein